MLAPCSFWNTSTPSSLMEKGFPGAKVRQFLLTCKRFYSQLLPNMLNNIKSPCGPKTPNIQHYEELEVHYMSSFFKCWERLGVK